MTESLQPGAPMSVGPFDATDIVLTSTSATTGVTQALTLPTVGGTQNAAYFFAAFVKIPDQNNSCAITGTILYERGGANILVCHTFDNNTASAARGTITVSLSNPNTSGVITITINWTDATTQNVTTTIRLLRMLQLQ